MVLLASVLGLSGAAIASSLAAATPALAATTAGQFIVRCPFDTPANPHWDGGTAVVGVNGAHAIKDDPIVHPGVVGGAHLHQFFGNRSTWAKSTGPLLRAVSADANGTTCGLHTDTAAYWTPALYLAGRYLDKLENGRPGQPIKIHAYYNGNGGAPNRVATPPAGAQLVGTQAYWHCGEGQTLSDGTTFTTPKASHPYDCDATRNGSRLYPAVPPNTPDVDGIVAVITMPDCWDGAGTARGHFEYRSTGSNSCRTGWIRIAQVQIHLHTGQRTPCPQLQHSNPACYDTAPASSFDPVSQLQFADTPAGALGSYATLHGDWWNAWNQTDLVNLTAYLNLPVNCGTINDAAVAPGGKCALPGH